MGSNNYELKTEELLKDYINELNLELVDIEFVKEGRQWYLRIYIDKQGVVDIEDCEKVSRYIDPILDEKDFITQEYVLEVSSPGLTRPLKKDKDFKRHIGDYIEIKLFKSYEGYKDFVGLLTNYDSDSITLKFEEEEFIKFDRNNIKVAKLAILF